ncbi:uncharacterized protein C8Q71DRAFT_888762 [Rhodofomes roseus]|uniref:Uncharacterized protein n=1 Tax=Rhodofomes roseus TaxID=34475 RepID=A0ABQ8JYK8_9APHY|nr:uncharacterized protein C8Q71DRAFT_888762 [Rhodofomes roseus]KAH9829352.1 hypothetical protein C8Q71DRAFT_888762 [Rhodofomes roseus]
MAIDGRDDFPELNWSNPAVHDSKPRPGSGMLPPLLLPPTRPNGAQLAPSQEETRTAIPHARSYYCAEHNGWVLLWSGTSTMSPPLARTIDNLPDPTRQKWTQSCVGDGEQPFGQVNATGIATNAPLTRST